MQQSAEKNHGLPPAKHVRQYLSREHRDAPGDGCTMAALSGDAARQSPAIKERFAQGIEDLLRAASPVTDGADGVSEAAVRQARERRLAVMAQMVGAMVLSRACPDDSPLADEILEVCREAILAGKR
jgi:TetR/AcrR family transcriptional regulator, transcriptional repressor for nem operon